MRWDRGIKPLLILPSCNKAAYYYYSYFFLKWPMVFSLIWTIFEGEIELATTITE